MFILWLYLLHAYLYKPLSCVYHRKYPCLHSLQYSFTVALLPTVKKHIILRIVNLAFILRPHKVTHKHMHMNYGMTFWGCPKHKDMIFRILLKELYFIINLYTARKGWFQVGILVTKFFNMLKERKLNYHLQKWQKDTKEIVIFRKLNVEWYFFNMYRTRSSMLSTYHAILFETSCRCDK